MAKTVGFFPSKLGVRKFIDDGGDVQKMVF